MKETTVLKNHPVPGVEKDLGKEQASAQVGVSLLRITFRVALVLTVAVIALIGIWAVAALVGGATSAGGPLEFIKSWFTAVNGG